MSEEVYMAKCNGLGIGIGRVLELMDDKARDACNKTVVIKVNFVSARRQLSATPVEAVEEYIKYLKSRCKNKIIIAEAPAGGGSFKDALEHYGYLKLKDYGVEFLDLSDDDYVDFYVWSRSLERNVRVRVSKTMLERDYLVSIVRPKTHDTVIVTLSIKNAIVGAILPGDRYKIHQGYKAINLSIAYLATHLMPNLSLIDGYIGMEGNGPVGGTSIQLGVSIGGFNPVTVDAATAYLMGFDPRDVGYLNYLSQWGYGRIDPSQLKIVGLENWQSVQKQFQPHSTYYSQLNWRLTPSEKRKIDRELEDLNLFYMEK